MLIGGFQKVSLIDYPGKMVAIVFTLGCNFNCPYCHNRELIFANKFPKDRLIDEKEIFNFLKRRKGLLEGVSITGGEPTLQPDLIDFISKIKEMGFLVKLDSNGTNPDVLEKLIKNKQVDYLAMDIKAPLRFKDYQKISKIKNEKLFEKVLKSVKLILNSGIDFEFRTSLTQGLLNKEDIIDIAKSIKSDKPYYLQNYINPQKEELDEEDKKRYNEFKPLSDEELNDLAEAVESVGQKCIIRN